MNDIDYMRRALELSEFGRGTTSPNPMVGCVIVHEDKIIGEGWTQPYGQAHAEVQAIRSVEREELLCGATAYVTLEPCSHFGKTPPCSDLIIEKKLGRVVVGAVDSNPQVGGKGIKRLRNAGIEVDVGLLENECRQMNARFFKSIEHSRPYVILKWAQTADGFVAKENYDSKWISGAESRSLVHQWRAEEDAIMVGTRTAQYDDPKLNVRSWSGKDPVRIVIDKELKLSKDLNLFDCTQKTIVYNDLKNNKVENLDHVQVDGQAYIPFILNDLNQRGIQSIIIEGGSALLNSFIKMNLWDEARVFTAPVNFEKGIVAPKLNGKQIEKLTIGLDTLTINRNPKPTELK